MSVTIQLGLGSKSFPFYCLNGAELEINVVKAGRGFAHFRLEDLTQGCAHPLVDLHGSNGVTTHVKCRLCGKVFK